MDSSALDIRDRADGARIAVRVQPRARRSELAGVHGGALRVRLMAPPVDGAANDALTTFLAERFGVPRRAVTIVSGHTSRDKVVEVEGVTSAQLRAAIGDASSQNSGG